MTQGNVGLGNGGNAASVARSPVAQARAREFSVSRSESASVRSRVVAKHSTSESDSRENSLIFARISIAFDGERDERSGYADLVLLREFADDFPHHAVVAHLEFVIGALAQLVGGENRPPLFDPGFAPEIETLLHQPARIEFGRQLILERAVFRVLARLEHGRQQRQPAKQADLLVGLHRDAGIPQDFLRAADDRLDFSGLPLEPLGQRRRIADDPQRVAGGVIGARDLPQAGTGKLAVDDHFFERRFGGGKLRVYAARG